MKTKGFIILLFLFVLFLTGCIGEKKVEKTERDLAIEYAKEIYKQKKSEDIDFSNGPCIANPIPELPGWVVDIAHDPRQEVDNLPENQCSAFSLKQSNHFIELDENGEIIKIF